MSALCAESMRVDKRVLGVGVAFTQDDHQILGIDRRVSGLIRSDLNLANDIVALTGDTD